MRRSIGPILFGAVAVASLAVGAASGLAVGFSRGARSVPAVLPPILPMPGAPHAAAEPAFRVPDEFLADEAERLATPLTQEGVRWVRTDGADLPPVASACGGFLASDARRVGAHQLALVSRGGWKLRRIVVYGDVAAARDAMAELRTAYRDCARHDDDAGRDTAWIWTSGPLDAGDESLFVGGQEYRGGTTLPAHYRGVVMRKGRTVVTYVDFNPQTNPPRPSEVDFYVRAARAMAERLAGAGWN